MTQGSRIKKRSQRVHTTSQIWWSVPLLLLLFALLFSGSRQLSLTYDEPSHLAAGYAYVARGMEGTWTIPLRGHPLLINAWEALPLYIGYPDLHLETLDGWETSRQEFARAFIRAVGPVEVSEVAGRLPAILITVLLAAVIFRWATDLWELPGGLIALGILSLDPALLAHGRLATNDVGVTAMGTLSLFLTWRWHRYHSWRLAAGAGVVLGVTLLSKSSGILWMGTCLIAAIWTAFQQPRAWRRTWAQIILMGGLALFVVWAMYGFSIGSIAALPGIPAPASLHWESILFQTGESSQRPFFALGVLETGQRWWYFPLAFVLKNPVPLLIALAIAFGVQFAEKHRSMGIWQLFAVVYVVVAIMKGPNIGYRHMLPLHPYFYLLIAGSVIHLWHASANLTRLGTAVLGIWYIVGTLRVYPNEIAFFNELVGGPDRGWYYLSDSNTDWMQGLKALKTWQEETHIQFNYSGPDGYVGLEGYDLDYISLPSTRNNPQPLFSPAFYPPPGDYIISAHTLNGLGLIDSDNYAWFRYHQPDATIAHVLFYYHVESPVMSAWLAQCQQPTLPLTEQAIAIEFGDLNPRHITFDCTQAWLYPAGTSGLGWYAIHGQLLGPEKPLDRLRPHTPRPDDDFAAEHLRDLPLGYRQYRYRQLPAFALYEWNDQASPQPARTKHYRTSAATPPATLDAVPPTNEPSALAGPLTFLGISPPTTMKDTFEVSTWWRVTDGPGDRPLSLMAHLITVAGEPLEVADGLGVPPAVWQTGDIIVQRHIFTQIPDEAWLRTGAYWLDDGTRWTVAGQTGADAFFIPLEAGQ